MRSLGFALTEQVSSQHNSIVSFDQHPSSIGQSSPYQSLLSPVSPPLLLPLNGFLYHPPLCRELSAHEPRLPPSLSRSTTMPVSSHDSRKNLLSSGSEFRLLNVLRGPTFSSQLGAEMPSPSAEERCSHGHNSPANNRTRQPSATCAREDAAKNGARPDECALSYPLSTEGACFGGLNTGTVDTCGSSQRRWLVRKGAGAMEIPRPWFCCSALVKSGGGNQTGVVSVS